MKKGIIMVVIILLAGSFRNSLPLMPGKNTLKILFVGNSYTFWGNLPQIISILSEDTKTKLITKKSVAGGATLSEHWRGEKGLKTKEMIRDGNFDIIVLQEQSMGAIDEPDTLLKYMKLFCGLIKKSKARPCLFLTWAPESELAKQETISIAYQKAGDENGAEVIAVGKAWALSRQLRPDIGLYDTDRSHPSNLGTILTACVFVEAFNHELPSELPLFYYTLDFNKESLMLMHIDKSDAALCRKVAVETINSQ
jgi:hypothetical protein